MARTPMARDAFLFGCSIEVRTRCVLPRSADVKHIPHWHLSSRACRYTMQMLIRPLLGSRPVEENGPSPMVLSLDLMMWSSSSNDMSRLTYIDVYTCRNEDSMDTEYWHSIEASPVETITCHAGSLPVPEPSRAWNLMDNKAPRHRPEAPGPIMPATTSVRAH